MFYFSTIEPSTLELLKEISANDLLKETRLVGGTALALQLGHRKSIDLDFFGSIDFISGAFQDFIDQFSRVEILVNSPHIKTYTLEGIKVDFVNYSYPWIETPIIQDQITLATPKDIAAMKISAITGRGSKKILWIYTFTGFFLIARNVSVLSTKIP